jgi:hexosaminidase
MEQNWLLIQRWFVKAFLIFIFQNLLFLPQFIQGQTNSANIPSSYGLNVMPVPYQIKLGTEKFRLSSDFSLSINDNPPARLFQGANRFLRRLDGRTGLFFKQGLISKEDPQKAANPNVFINSKKEGQLKLNEDESYQLKISSNKINLDASTDIGALRGLETLLQLLSIDDQGYYFPVIEINDQPRFAWRGLMIDAARHFMPLDVLKRNLDAMAAVKMNVFHFHLCDNQGWRVESKVFPKLHLLGSDGLYYTQNEIREIVQYAGDRGIRVMPEFDVPGHATAILVAYPELASAAGPYTIERNSGIFDPVLNPTIDQTYEFLDKLFTEMSALFPDDYFHIGGDENNGRNWKTNPEIQAFMKKNNLNSVLELQTYFNNRLIKTIQKLNKKMVGWEEIFQPGLDKNAIIHSWLGKPTLFKAAAAGYQAILSNGYYIDLLQPAKDHYLNDPLPDFLGRSEKEKQFKLSPEQEKLILGGEATMWSELVTPFTIDSRIWPRTAAIAERLWSPASVKDVKDMYRRLDHLSFRLEELGLTHVKNKEAILRNLANGNNVEPLEILTNVIEPYKIYNRNFEGTMYKSYSPFTLMADAATADAKDARIFGDLVEEYSLSKDPKVQGKILLYLKIWRSNHSDFVEISKKSPVLRNMDSLSLKLKLVSEIGMEALKKGVSTEDWYKTKVKVIADIKLDSEKKKNNATFEDGRTELVILDSILKLLDLTNPELAKKRMIEEEAKKKKEAVSEH